MPVDQVAPLLSKPITRISSGSETDKFSDLLRVGTINGKPCRLLIDTGC